MSAGVIAYLRVSTEEQASSGAGLGAQRAALEAEAQRRGWAGVDWVTDEGWSAKDLRRPGITSALAELKAGRAGVLAVARLDRLSRSVLDFTTVVDRARRQGWELVVLDPPFDLATAAGELLANMLAAFAQFERRLIGQRTAEAMAMRKAEGVHCGRSSTLDPAAVERWSFEPRGSPGKPSPMLWRPKGGRRVRVAAGRHQCVACCGCEPRRLKPKAWPSHLASKQASWFSRSAS